MTFSLFVAGRYLRARRKEAVISIITLISIAGVSAGVAALVIALAINNGFRSTLQRNLLGATAHVNIQSKDGQGISEWRALVPRLLQIPHVTGASPVLYGYVLVAGPLQVKGAVLKGIDPQFEKRTNDSLLHLKEGRAEGLKRAPEQTPGIILGSKLAQDTGMLMNANVTIISPQGTMTPFGPEPKKARFHVVGIFESGFYDFDDNWAYGSLDAVQNVLSLPGIVNSIEFKLDDIDKAPEVAAQAEKIAGPRYSATTWQEQSRTLFNAFRTERIVTVITIGLIQMVAALNIFITLVMMVMEKYKDIAVLMSMGARRSQIRNIFMLQGVLIGIAGSAIGLATGYALCYFADRYRWIKLDETVYALSYVPFDARAFDGVWIAGAAIAISFLATIYPARNATRITPVEVLRYE
jgi:lipoprotein-releasing system permease protein